MGKVRIFGLLFSTLGSLALTACGGGGNSVITPPPQGATVVVSPKQASVAATTQLQQFTATVTGTVTDLSVSWTVDTVAGGNSTVGTISSSGLYTPPATGGTHTITATSNADASASDTASIAVSDLAGVFTYHNDLARDGSNQQEYGLTTTTVNTSSFGKLFSCAVDGAVYTQPLWVPGMNIAGGTHNVIFVATQHDSVYAFDADANPCVKLWQVSLVDTLHGATSGETPAVWSDVGYCYGDIYPEVGVTGTPVIDPSTNTMYVVSASEIVGSVSGCNVANGSFFHRLHALDLLTGNEKSNSPVTIQGSVPGVGDGSSGGMVSFISQLHHNRSGLALSGGVVYVAFAAHEDRSPYHGWLFGYNAANLQQAPSIFNTTPNGGLGGIWGGGGAPAVDSTGDVYVATGNGIFDANSSSTPYNDYGDSILRLHPSTTGATANGTNLDLAGWFTPYNQDSLSQYDTDLGSGAVILLPDQTSGPTHLLALIGKDGFLYLMDRDNMGSFNPTDNSQILENFSAGGGLWGTPAFWQNALYYAGNYDSLKRYAFDGGTFNQTTSSESNTGFPFPDATPSISSQGSSNGIAWAINATLYGYASPSGGAGVNCYVSPVPSTCSGPAVLHAYDATNVGTELWNSSQAASNRDQAGNAVKFVPPTIANGRVYIGTRTEVDVYGLLPTPSN